MKARIAIAALALCSATTALANADYCEVGRQWVEAALEASGARTSGGGGFAPPGTNAANLAANRAGANAERTIDLKSLKVIPHSSGQPIARDAGGYLRGTIGLKARTIQVAIVARDAVKTSARFAVSAARQVAVPVVGAAGIVVGYCYLADS